MFPKRARLKTFPYVGRYRYFLTLCTRGRHKALLTEANVDLVRSEIVKTARACEMAVSAYVFMPDHCHLLVAGLEMSSDLKRFVHLAKQKSGYAYSRATGQQLWQPSFYDHVLRDGESSLPVIHYILQNPVRSGLVLRCEEYPYLGSETMTLEEIRAMLQEAGAASWG